MFHTSYDSYIKINCAFAIEVNKLISSGQSFLVFNSNPHNSRSLHRRLVQQDSLRNRRFFRYSDQ